MYVRIETRKNKFVHNSNSKLLFGVAVGDRRAILFYSTGNFYEYDLFEDKILYTSTLEEKPYKAISVNPTQIICLMTGSRKVVRIDIKNKSLQDLCRLPLNSTHDETKDRSIFFLTTLNRFKQTRSFYIDESCPDQNRRRIIYFLEQPGKDRYVTKDFQSFNFVFEPIDDCSKIAIYKQTVQIDRPWEFRVVDLADNFSENRYQLQHKSLNPNCVVEQVWAKNSKEIMIFVNGPQPEILIFNVEKSTITESTYKLSMNFQRLCLYNPEFQTACLCYISNNRINGELYQNIVELIDLERGVLVQSGPMTLKDISSGWENEYLLDICPENRSGNVSIFHTRHFIKKKSLYFNILIRTKVRQVLGNGMLHDVLSLLQ